MCMIVPIGVSKRHVHITRDVCIKLFGNDELPIRNPLNQPGQYASTLTVDVEWNGKIIEHVRVVGPLRNYTQCEISKTDAFFLKLNPPVRDSGDLEGAEEIEIRNGNRKLIRKCVIIANRHIHIDPKTRQELNLVGVEKVKLRVHGEKGGILDNVHIKERNDFYYELHLDCDDANSHFFSNDDELEIII